MIRRNSIWSHIISILVLPFSVIAIIPYFIHNFIDFRCCHLFEYVPGILSLLIALPLLGLGSYFLFATIQLFARKGNGTLAPWDPPKNLVIEGPYEHVRNPMISAVNLILLSVALILENENLLLWQIIFFLINTVYFIAKEEVDLQTRFGEQYMEYKANVNRWIPSVKPWKSNYNETE